MSREDHGAKAQIHRSREAIVNRSICCALLDQTKRAGEAVLTPQPRLGYCASAQTATADCMKALDEILDAVPVTANGHSAVNKLKDWLLLKLVTSLQA
jgi:hypothetical protein